VILEVEYTFLKPTCWLLLITTTTATATTTITTTPTQGCDEVRIRIRQHANIQQLYSYSIFNK